MEELLLLLSLDDIFALLATFVGGLTSIVYLRHCLHPHMLAMQVRTEDAYRPSINIRMIETYPMDSWGTLRSRLFRRKQHTDSESDALNRLLVPSV
ncbi:hypothetical protein ACAF76_019225 [Brevibacillus sp. TJ4]|uniref:hypothetical protein n=1 Tax=Brevibacillus sp. TJ4 TaxID=3234853 RepID=UPI003BA29D68